jgi:diacylglycerol kinase family enzyme
VQAISVDGETGQRTPVLVSVAAGALALVVPRGSNAETRAAV